MAKKQTTEPPEIQKTIEQATKAVQKAEVKQFNRTDYLMLSSLRNNSANSFLTGATLREWQDYINGSISARQMQRKVKRYLNAGLISTGVKDGSCKSYFITKEGLNKIKEMEEV